MVTPETSGGQGRPWLLQRDARLVLGCTDRERGLDAGNVRRRRELAGQELLEALQVLADDLEDEVDFPVEHVTFADVWKIGNVLLESAQVFLGLALEADHREDRDRETEAGWIEIGVVAANDASFLQRANAAQARWRGEADTAGKINVGDAAFGLKLGQQPAVYAVERRQFSPRFSSS